MGGSGSTRWEWHRKARTVENCASISTVRPREQLTRHIGVIKPTGGGSWVTRCCLDDAREGLFEIVMPEGAQPTLRVTLSAVGSGMADGQSHTITFAGMRPHLGGTRWLYYCPLCNRRTAFLYLVPRASRFACRLCYGLSYRSSQQSHVVPELVSVDAAICRLRRQVDDLMRRSSK
jgi:hypothetical protein